MASAGGNILPPDIAPNQLLAGIAGVAIFAFGLSQLYTQSNQKSDDGPGLFKSLLLFCYSCFIKPHAASDERGSQQAHLEGFYSSQAKIYDKTRKTLLKGREDMLALVAAQLRFKAEKDKTGKRGHGKQKRIWVDV
jgi:betaine lipid synthase